MQDDFISVKDFAEANGLHRKTVFKILKRLDIEAKLTKGGRENGGQIIALISNQEGQRVLNEMASTKRSTDSVLDNDSEESGLFDPDLWDACVFYLMMLEPEHDPNRIKVGFAGNIDERLRKHRCSAPFVKTVRTWPCKRLWEKTAIECVTDGYPQLHTEVFRADSIQSVEDRYDKFFVLMPNPARKSG